MSRPEDALLASLTSWDMSADSGDAAADTFNFLVAGGVAGVLKCWIGNGLPFSG